MSHLPIAPMRMRMKPIVQPVRVSTYGKERTPDPIAEAQREKILPLREPFSSLPKVLLK